MAQERTLPTFNTATVQITKEEGLGLYEDMTLGRLFEDKCAEMYYRGKMFGFVHLYNGQEAVCSGIIKGAMRPGEDFVSSTKLIPDGKVGVEIQMCVWKRLSPALEGIRKSHTFYVDRCPVALRDDLVGDASRGEDCREVVERPS